MTHLIVSDGITIAEFKRLLDEIPEKGSHGKPFQIWYDKAGEARLITEVLVMGSDFGGGDVVLVSKAENNSNECLDKDRYIHTLEYLQEEYEKVLNIIPECPVHGPGCLPHAIEWILRYKLGEGESD